MQTQDKPVQGDIEDTESRVRRLQAELANALLRLQAAQLEEQIKAVQRQLATTNTITEAQTRPAARPPTSKDTPTRIDLTADSDPTATGPISDPSRRSVSSLSISAPNGSTTTTEGKQSSTPQHNSVDSETPTPATTNEGPLAGKVVLLSLPDSIHRNTRYSLLGKLVKKLGGRPVTVYCKDYKPDIAVVQVGHRSHASIMCALTGVPIVRDAYLDAARKHATFAEVPTQPFQLRSHSSLRGRSFNITEGFRRQYKQPNKKAEDTDTIRAVMTWLEQGAGGKMCGITDLSPDDFVLRGDTESRPPDNDNDDGPGPKWITMRELQSLTHDTRDTMATPPAQDQREPPIDPPSDDAKADTGSEADSTEHDTDDTEDDEEQTTESEPEPDFGTLLAFSANVDNPQCTQADPTYNHSARHATEHGSEISCNSLQYLGNIIVKAMKKDCDSVLIEGQTWCAYCNHRVDDDGKVHTDTRHKSLHFPKANIRLWYWATTKGGRLATGKHKKTYFTATYGVCTIRLQDIQASTIPNFNDSKFASDESASSPPPNTNSPACTPSPINGNSPQSTPRSPIDYGDNQTPGGPSPETTPQDTDGDTSAQSADTNTAIDGRTRADTSQAATM